MFVVTGATARTGGAIARALLAAGLPVRAIGRDRGRLQDLVDLGAEAFVADPRDAAAMLDAFAGASAAWVMLQPNYIPDSPDFRAFQSAIIAATVPALRRAEVPRIVSLSSWSAYKDHGNGPVAGLHDLEVTLDGLETTDVLHLRAGYFMENSLGWVPQARRGDVVEGPFDPTRPLPWIATRDIASASVIHLREESVPHRSVRELQGQRDLPIREAVSIIGAALGRPLLRYAETSMEAARAAMVGEGVSENVAALMVEVARSINDGSITFNEARSAANTTATSFETFVAETWLTAYEGWKDRDGQW